MPELCIGKDLTVDFFGVTLEVAEMVLPLLAKVISYEGHVRRLEWLSGLCCSQLEHA